MRRFVVTSPGLSVGRPGTVVTGEQLRMDDDKLDAFVEAGLAHEIFDADPHDVPVREGDPPMVFDMVEPGPVVATEIRGFGEAPPSWADADATAPPA